MPVFQNLVFPEDVVQKAIANVVQRAQSVVQPVIGGLEVCRYEEPFFPPDDGNVYDTMSSMLSQTGRLLEVIGYASNLRISDGALQAELIIVDNLHWKNPLMDHSVVPYVTIDASQRTEGRRVVTSFTLTEIVLVFHEVTIFAIEKYRNRRNRNAPRS